MLVVGLAEGVKYQGPGAQSTSRGLVNSVGKAQRQKPHSWYSGVKSRPPPLKIPSGQENPEPVPLARHHYSLRSSPLIQDDGTAGR